MARPGSRRRIRHLVKGTSGYLVYELPWRNLLEPPQPVESALFANPEGDGQVVLLVATPVPTHRQLKDGLRLVY